MTTPVPAWLADALARHPVHRLATRASSIAAGDLCLVHLDDGGRIVLVIEVDGPSGLSSVVLTTHETDAITDQDLVVTAAEAGLPFAVVIETDLVGPLPTSALHGSVIGSLANDLQTIVEAARWGTFGAGLDGRRGIPIQGPRDARWSFKELEGAALDRIVAWGAAAETSAKSVTLTHRAATDAGAIPELTVVLLRLVSQGEPFPRTVVRFIADPANFSAFGHDAIRAFEPALRLAA